jgi:hypothetical protein
LLRALKGQFMYLTYKAQTQQTLMRERHTQQQQPKESCDTSIVLNLLTLISYYTLEFPQWVLNFN